MIPPELFDEVRFEHQLQQDRHGAQNYPNGTGSDQYWILCDQIRTLCSHKTAMKTVTWLEVLMEEFLEVASERDPKKLRAELIQGATVALAWVSKLDQKCNQPKLY